MSLVSSLKNKFTVFSSLVFFVIATPANADPVVAGELLPPAAAALIRDPELIEKIGVGRANDPVWCYSNDANAILITAAERERESCALKISQEISRLTAEHKLELGTLSVQLESLTKKHNDLMSIKNKEIEDLTAAALKRPNDYSLWWASGGVVLGVATTLVIFFAVTK